MCIDFRDLNAATPKDEYPMLVAEMLVDYAAGFEYMSMLDGYSGYNQIFIAEEDVSKTSFHCPGALGTYEWVVMPFGLKNAGATVIGGSGTDCLTLVREMSRKQESPPSFMFSNMERTKAQQNSL